MTTATSITISASVPDDSPEPVEWDVQYGFRFFGGWNQPPSTAPSSQSGRLSQMVTNGAGRTWTRSIDGLSPDTTYILQVRARVGSEEDGEEGWSSWSKASARITTAKEDKRSSTAERVVSDRADVASEPIAEPQATEPKPKWRSAWQRQRGTSLGASPSA